MTYPLSAPGMSTHSKKRKPAAPDQSLQPKKKAKTEEAKTKSKDKGKARETDAEAEFQVIHASLVVSIPPIFANSHHAGVQEMLDSMVMRFVQ